MIHSASGGVGNLLGNEAAVLTIRAEPSGPSGQECGVKGAAGYAARIHHHQAVTDVSLWATRAMRSSLASREPIADTVELTHARALLTMRSYGLAGLRQNRCPGMNDAMLRLTCRLCSCMAGRSCGQSAGRCGCACRIPPAVILTRAKNVFEAVATTRTAAMSQPPSRYWNAVAADVRACGWQFHRNTMALRL